MGKSGKGLIVRDLDQLFRRGAVFVADGELLARFLASGDEGAFESIVTRHGPMVRGVCGRLLRDPHDADDAFQATFLVLARYGGKLRDPDRLSSWLYSIARRVSLRARARADRRRAQPLVHDVPAREDARAEWSDLWPVLDAELARMPAPQRDVLVLCLLGGASEQEASQRLDCPVGTVKSRLSRAREALRGRLLRRGVAPAAALAASSAESFASPASSLLIRATLATITAKAPVSPAVAALIQGVSSTMLSKPILVTLALAGGLGLLGLTMPAWTASPPHHPQTVEDSAVPQASEAADVKVKNLQRLLVAMLQSMSATDTASFPAAAIHGPDGQPLLSWRVAILPFLGEEALYREFHLDEPWDGPHNRSLIARMPAVYRTPDIPTQAGRTRFRGFSIPGAMFDPNPNPAAMGMMMGGMMSSGMTGRGGRMDGMGIGMDGSGVMSAGSGSSVREGVERSGTGRGETPPEPEKAEDRDRREDDPNDPAAEGAMGRGMGISPDGPLEGMGAAGAGPAPRAPNQGVGMAEITDGTSNTAFLVVASEAVEWTRPGEIDADPSQAAASFDGGDPRGFVVGLVDGAARFLPPSPNRPRYLAALLSRAGGEILDWSDYVPRTVPAALMPVPPLPLAEARMKPSETVAPASPVVEPPVAEPSLEQRMQRVEEKLDRLLQKLDAGDPDDEATKP
ncbi:sigma-70 family RNA polymerase sigma factor [Planctomyces sp. SH-PL62]|uniref:sigma-70 family RNA polymerase sigma factor n=1 Tax=Planctomyces sp. SH-PL62 TaxID=1636152 RepID=UPI00078BD0AA|nr:sigma-70 family RNA polymerase sigma factor [Planctomyces sp. SH-PL62]AMV36242.1 ECF RNA polymerase sigma factor SigE [Planctomyces sp. SH-PL62]